MTIPNLKRVFLGWDAPLVSKVRDYLLTLVQTEEGQAPDLEGILIIVPTRQAGRRLRESLALWCHERDTALLSAQIVLPNYIFSTDTDRVDIAGEVTTLSSWVKVLMQINADDMPALFPSKSDEPCFQWALNTGEIIQSLRSELSDGAYTIGSIVDDFGDQLEELDRWRDLARLESTYLEELQKKGKQDLCLAKIASAKQVKLDEGIRKVVVAGVPDPNLLAVSALKSIAYNGIDIEILIHAEPDLAEVFDEWGRPDPGYWSNVNIDIFDWENNVHLEVKPVEQAERVISEIAASHSDYEPGEIAIGVPDRSVIPFLKKVMSARKLQSFDPADKAVGDHSIGKLSETVLELLREGLYRDVADLLRHPDYMRYLRVVHGVDTLLLLKQLDEFQNYYLPLNFRIMLGKFEDNPKGAISYRDDFSELGKALIIVQSTIEIFKGNRFEDSWRSFYQEIYLDRQLKPAAARDAEFKNAAEIIDGLLREFREIDISGYDLHERASLFIKILKGKMFHRERRDETIDLEGWLELPWNDRPFLMVTGMNEEFVPGGSLSDVFLPDSLRRLLDLRDDAGRFSRDVFLMKGMLASRRSEGRACFILGKTAVSGDPLKPSRLFFRCSDAELPERVTNLLAEPESSGTGSYPEVIFQLDPDKPKRKEKREKYISVTSFKDYLACPFRYYLKHILGMEESDDSKAGLDAMDFGNIVHSVLQDMGSDKDLWSMSDAQKLGDVLADLASEKVTSRFGSPPSPYVIVSLYAAQERLRAAALEQVRLVQEGWDVINVETGQGGKGNARDRWRLQRGDFVISGIIDRIDRHRESGEIRIMDYKTFDSAKNTAENMHLQKRGEGAPDYNLLDLKTTKSNGSTASNARRWIDLQLALYAMIYSQDTEYHDDIELGYFLLPKVVSETGVKLWNEFDSERMLSAVSCMDGVLGAIDRGIYWPPADKVSYDDFEKMFRFDKSVKVLKS